MTDNVVTAVPPTLAAIRASGPIALFLDLDGTLVDIAPTPDSISVPERLARRLEELAERNDGRVVLVSGRSASNIAQHIGPVAIGLAGSHGIDRHDLDGVKLGPQAEPLPEEAAKALEGFAASHPGLAYEAKSHGGALHYRAAPSLGEAAIAFVEQLAASHGLAVKRGKCVAELVHPGADKAGAVYAFMGESGFAGATPIFIGDDITDEDGFRAVNELGGFGVIVGERPTGFARYRLATPAEVHEWLEL